MKYLIARTNFLGNVINSYDTVDDYEKEVSLAHMKIAIQNLIQELKPLSHENVFKGIIMPVPSRYIKKYKVKDLDAWKFTNNYPKKSI